MDSNRHSVRVYHLNKLDRLDNLGDDGRFVDVPSFDRIGSG